MLAKQVNEGLSGEPDLFLMDAQIVYSLDTAINEKTKPMEGQLRKS